MRQNVNFRIVLFAGLCLNNARGQELFMKANTLPDLFISSELNLCTKFIFLRLIMKLKYAFLILCLFCHSYLLNAQISVSDLGLDKNDDDPAG
jgi:hypothetical protein